MPECQFEEKEYEVQMVIELARPRGGRRYLAPSGQAIEKLLGYDAAADPESDDPIWAAIDKPRPAGVRLLPPMFAPDLKDQPLQERLPIAPVTLLLQFKRPYRVTRRRGASPPALVPVPSFRIAVESEQHAVLSRLEMALSTSALVRYAAPAFHTIAELERARLLNDAVSRSSYIAPSAVNLHTYWYYEQAGSRGWGNPEPEQLELENAAMLANRLERAEASASAGGQSIREHVSGLADGIRTADGYTELLVARWIADLESSIVELTNDLRESLRDLATVSTFVQRWNLVWLLSYLVR